MATALRQKEEETKEIEEKMRQAEEEARKVEEARKKAEEERKKFEEEKAENEAAVSTCTFVCCRSTLLKLTRMGATSSIIINLECSYYSRSQIGGCLAWVPRLRVVFQYVFLGALCM